MINFDPQEFTGLIPVYKPVGLSSKDISRKIISAVGYKKLQIGHVGTLDPFADGVLPVLVGKATRLQDYLLELPKSYSFDVTFGYETTTLDVEGSIVHNSDVDFSDDELQAAVDVIKSCEEQIPPIYSAIKVAGKPLYSYARANDAEAIDLKKLIRNIRIYSLTIENWDRTTRVCRLNVHCSKGTYVRSLARDIAYKLGTHATVTKLTRTHAAGLSLEQTMSIDEFFEDGRDYKSWLIPLANMPLLLKKISIDEIVTETKIRFGQRVSLDQKYIQAGFFMPQKVLLEGNSGKIFGLGNIQISDTEGLSIQMIRGLE